MARIAGPHGVIPLVAVRRCSSPAWPAAAPIPAAPVGATDAGRGRRVDRRLLPIGLAARS